MSGSQREDFLLRQIQVIAAMLARMAGLRAEGDHVEARAELNRTYAVLLDEQLEIVQRVDSDTAVMLLGAPVRARAYAELLIEQAEQESDASRANCLRQRASEVAAAAGGAMTAARRPQRSES